MSEFHRNRRTKDGHAYHCKSCRRETKRPQDSRRWWLNYRYGLTPEDVAELVAHQEGRCGICRTPLGDNHQQHVDHDHETGQVRGVLCNACNTGLGKLGDTIEGVRRALNYLEKANAITDRDGR